MFLLLTLLIAMTTAALAIWPIVAHPTLPAKTKRLIAAFVVITIVPFGLTLYIALGVPQLAVF